MDQLRQQLAGDQTDHLAAGEAGHIAQNALLAATATGCGGLPVGGFTDDVVNRLLGVDGVHEATLYLILLGGEPQTTAVASALPLGTAR